jgi:membrane protease YdiL (CAAX protease family)
MPELAWDRENINFSIAVLWGVAGFASYYFLSKAEIPARSLSNRLRSDIRVTGVVIQRSWGLLFTGIISALIATLVFKESLADFGLGFGFEQLPPWWSYLVLPLILVSGYYSSSSPGNLKLYPQIRIETWTPCIVAISAVSWILFLVAYEFLFRGFLLGASLMVMGPWPAISLNTALYAFAHFYKGPGETYGAIPIGFLLCYLTLVTGNIWSAVVIHSVMALSNEWFSIMAHPEMQIKIGR